MVFSITATVLAIAIFAYFLARFGRERGTYAEVITTGGLVVAFFFYDLFSRLIISALNLLLFVASAVVGRVQGRPPESVNFKVDYDKDLNDAWRLGLRVFSFVFLAVLFYIFSNRFRKMDKGKPLNAKSFLGTVLGAVNAVIILGTLFLIAGPLDFSRLNFNLTIPSISLSIVGTKDNPLGDLPIWFPPIIAGVIIILLINTFGKGLPTQSVTRTRIFRVLGILILVAALVAVATLINRRV